MNQQTTRLLEEVMEACREAIAKTLPLTNEELDRPVTIYGGREAPIRVTLYQMVAHPREHAVHIAKILQETGSPAGRPTEAQMIQGLMWHALGELMAVCSRLEDSDLGREMEGQTIARVLEHVRDSYRSYTNRLEGLAQG